MLSKALPKTSILLGIIGFTDGTSLSGSGSQGACPFFVSLANHPQSFRQQPSGHRLVCYLPELQGKGEGMKRKKLELYHRALAVILAPIRHAQEKGEQRFHNQSLHHFVPRYILHIRDLLEGAKATMVKMQNCQACLESQKFLGDFSRTLEPRLQEKLRPTMDEARMILLSGESGCITSAKDMLKPFLMKPCYAENGFFDLKDFDLYQNMYTDAMHRDDLGLVPALLDFLKEWVKDTNGSSAAGTFQRKLDQIMASAPPFPSLVHTFPNGISGLTTLTASNYRCIMQLLPTAVRRLEAMLSKEIVAAIESYSALYHALLSEEFTESDLADIDELIKQFRSNLQVFQGTSKSELHFLKLHELRHVTKAIREVGRPAGYSSASSEMGHKGKCKIPYRMSNKKNVFPQMLRQVEISEAFSSPTLMKSAEASPGVRLLGELHHLSLDKISSILTSEDPTKKTKLNDFILGQRELIELRKKLRLALAGYPQQKRMGYEHLLPEVDDLIRVFNRAIVGDHTFLASPSFHGAPRYSTFTCLGEEKRAKKVWAGEMRLIFEATMMKESFKMAFVRWFHHQGGLTYRLSEEYDVVSFHDVTLRLCHMIPVLEERGVWMLNPDVIYESPLFDSIGRRVDIERKYHRCK